MALLNIGAGNQDDAFYRYKMPRLVTKIEGRGNGIKTNVVNMVDVAKALARSPAYTTKYFGCELGAQSKFDEKTATSIVNGAHDTAKLAGLLENFIKKYVQCYGCGNPETEINITKVQTISLKCAACGFMSDVDIRDKLTAFILKNPPEQRKGGKKDKNLRRAEKERLKAGEAADEEKKKVLKDAQKNKSHDDEKKVTRKKFGSEEDVSPVPSQVDEDEINHGDDDVEWQTDTSAEAAKQRIKEQLTLATSEMVMLGAENDVLFPTSTAGTGNKEPLTKLSSKKANVVAEESKLSEVMEKIPEVEKLSLHDRLVMDFKDCLQKGYTPSQLASHIESREEPEQDIMVAYFEALFAGFTKTSLTKEVGKNKLNNLVKVVKDVASQTLLLNAIEVFHSSTSPESKKDIALLLKALYEEDILEEEQILEWYDRKGTVLNSSARQVRKFAQPFVDWLRSAEPESEDE